MSAIREGEVPGIHTIKYESEADSIVITHDAKNRKGFALGAVLAAEYTAAHQGFLGMKLVLYLIFLIWLKSWLGLVVVPFIFDAYISKKIPWTWWKKSTNKTVLTVMGWVDAIVFALVAVYFVNLYFFQNYVIPSSSLEKSLLVGDYLFVSKMSYGARIPQTPLHMPLTQHTLPVFNYGRSGTTNGWPDWERCS